MWHLATGGAIFTVGLVPGAGGVTGCGILPPTCSTTNFHRTTTSRGFVLAPNRSGAASRRQPTKAGIWSWCAGRALAKVSVISRLESRSTRGSCRWEDETEECGPRAGRRPDACWLEAAWQCHQWRHLVAGRVSHDVALQRSASSQPAPSAPRPLHRLASNRRPGSHLKIARCSLIACH